MKRKEFLKTIHKSIIKPLITILVLCFVVNFLIRAVFEQGDERSLTYMISLFLGVTGFFYAIKLLYIKVYELLPEIFKKTSLTIIKLINEISPFIIGILFTYYWNEKKLIIVILSVYIVIEKLIKINRNEQIKKKNYENQ